MSHYRFVVGPMVFISLACALGSACRSKSSDNSTGTISQPRPDAGACTKTCCDLPQPGTSCANADAGTTCGYAVTCAEGLVLTRTTQCENGVWTAVNDCPPSGGVDERGCPAAQPVDKSPCATDASRGTVNCGYSKTCDAKACDGSDCVPIHQSASAQCIQGVWQTKALGPC